MVTSDAGREPVSLGIQEYADQATLEATAYANYELLHSIWKPEREHVHEK